jgi:hypothetical protein
MTLELECNACSQFTYSKVCIYQPGVEENITHLSALVSIRARSLLHSLTIAQRYIVPQPVCAFHFPSEPPLYTLLEALHNGELETCQEIQLTCSVTSEIKLEAAAATATPSLPLLLGREERRVRLWFGCIWACDYY